MSSTNTLPSLYIPFVYTSTEDEKIRSVIEIDYGLGKISYIDYVLKENGDGMHHYSVYIHFETFNFDEITEKFLEHAKDTKNPPRLYYEYGKPYFWKVMLNSSYGKHMCPRVKIDYNKPSFKRDEIQIPTKDEEPVLSIAPSLPEMLPIAPCLPEIFSAIKTLPEGVTPLILPELCSNWHDEWNENMSEITDTDTDSPYIDEVAKNSIMDLPVSLPKESKRTVFTQRLFPTGSIAEQEQERENELQRSLESLAKKAFPFSRPLKEERERCYPQFDGRYRECQSKLLYNLTQIYEKHMAQEAEIYSLDFYEGSSGQANWNDGFEGSSIQANMMA